MRLKHRKVVITRQAEQANDLIRLLEQEGAQPLLFPTIAIVAADDFEEKQKQVLHNLEQFDWLVFSSQNAVRFFAQALSKFQQNLPEIKIAAVGKRTAETLEQLGFPVHLLPHDYSARGLIDAFASMELRGSRFLLPASSIARDELAAGLKLHGADVESVVFYKTVPNPNFNKTEFLTLLQNKALDVITFFSPSAFRYLIELLGTEGLNLLQISETLLAAIGKTTARAIHDQGLKVHIMPKVSTSKELVESIVDYYQKGN